MTDDVGFGGSYSFGTVTVTGADAHVVGHTVTWTDVVEGDWLTKDGLAVPILSVDFDASTLELLIPWPGSTSTGTYAIMKMSWQRYEPALTGSLTREMLENLRNAGVILAVALPDTEPDPQFGRDGQFAIQIDNGPWTFWKKIAEIWEPQVPPVGGIVYDIGGFSPDRPGGNENILSWLFNRSILFPVGLSGSQARCDIAPTADTVLTMKKQTTGGVVSTIGTITFLAGVKTGTFSFTSAVTFASGEVLNVVNQAVHDATAADIHVTFAATRN